MLLVTPEHRLALQLKTHELQLGRYRSRELWRAAKVPSLFLQTLLSGKSIASAAGQALAGQAEAKTAGYEKKQAGKDQGQGNGQAEASKSTGTGEQDGVRGAQYGEDKVATCAVLEQLAALPYQDVLDESDQLLHHR